MGGISLCCRLTGTRRDDERPRVSATPLGGRRLELGESARESQFLGDLVQSLILDLLEWIAPRPRPYSEVIEAWRTSCPRLPVWEEATERAFVELRSQEGGPLFVYVTFRGREFLDRHREIEHTPPLLPEP